MRLVEALPSPVDCADVAALSAPLPRPSDPAAAARLADLERRLAEQDLAAIAATDLEPIAAAAETLVNDARALGHEPFVAEALLSLGILRARRGKLADGAQTLKDALIAAQASGHDHAVARVSIKLCAATSRYEGARSHEWARLADATLDRIGSPPALTAEHEGAFAALLETEGKPIEAVTHSEAAVAASERAGQVGSLVHAGYLNDLGAHLDSAGRFPEARRHLEAALAIRERLLGALHPDVAGTLNNLAVVDEREGRWAEALARYERAYQILVALDLARTARASMLLDSQAGPLRKLGRIDEALARQRLAIEILEQRNPNDPRLASRFNNIGNTLSQAGRLDEALASYERARALYVAAHGEHHVKVAIALENLGELRVTMGQAEAALPLCERARAINEASLGADHPDVFLGYVVCEVPALLALGRRAAAEAALRKALAIAVEMEAYPVEKTQALLLEARVIQARDPARATRLATQARDRFIELGNEKGRLDAEAFLQR